MSAAFLLVVLFALLVLAPPIVFIVNRMTDAAINECLRKIRMHE